MPRSNVPSWQCAWFGKRDAFEFPKGRKWERLEERLNPLLLRQSGMLRAGETNKQVYATLRCRKIESGKFSFFELFPAADTCAPCGWRIDTEAVKRRDSRN